MKKYFGSNKPRIILKKGKAKPVWHHHPWIFSGAVDEANGNMEDGDIVEVLDDTGRFIGKGFVNLKSQIMVRMLTWDLHEKIDDEFFRKRIHQAVFFREAVLAMSSKASAYRLIHSEGDSLPGLTVDRYNNVLVAQFLSTGMENRKEMIIDILKKEAQADTVVERYPAGYREKEGLPSIDYAVHGQEPPENMEITEYGLKFRVSLQQGQKTGFYLDQRENRMQVSKFGRQKRVLDAFCYTGGFGIYLLSKGKASEAVFLDSSPLSLKLVKENLELNEITGKTDIRKEDIFKTLPEMQNARERFDIIILDPPKVAPDKASLPNALESLEAINTTAMRMIDPGGIFVTCDCSGCIGLEEFLRVVNRSSIVANKILRIIALEGAGPDHPINPSCIENSYLKVIIAEVE